MTPVLCNRSPISQKGGVAVLCPVAVLGMFPYVNQVGNSCCPSARPSILSANRFVLLDSTYCYTLDEPYVDSPLLTLRAKWLLRDTY